MQLYLLDHAGDGLTGMVHDHAGAAADGDMLHDFVLHPFVHAIEHSLYMLPVLIVVFLIIGFIEKRAMGRVRAALSNHGFGVVGGALLGADYIEIVGTQGSQTEAGESTYSVQYRIMHKQGIGKTVKSLLCVTDACKQNRIFTKRHFRFNAKPFTQNACKFKSVQIARGRADNDTAFVMRENMRMVFRAVIPHAKNTQCLQFLHFLVKITQFIFKCGKKFLLLIAQKPDAGVFGYHKKI